MVFHTPSRIPVILSLVVLAGCSSSAATTTPADDAALDAGDDALALDAADALATDAPADATNDAAPIGDGTSPDGSDAASADSASADSATADGAIPDTASADSASADTAVDAAPPLPGVLTTDFQTWLAAHGYGADDFARMGTGGSFGGRATAGDAVPKIPIVFVHGNSDAAIGRGGQLTGWDAPRRYLLSRGWTDAALYATTWGPADPTKANDQSHDRAYLTRLRRFISAVQQYTGASKVVVVTHSMGTTLARKAIEGGSGTDAAGADALGAPLTSIVDTFIGIAGANWGLVYCYSTPDPATCSKVYGFWPGANATDGPSTVLAAMNATSHDEGAHVFSYCSKDDEILGLGGVVWGKSTCSIPGEDAAANGDGLQHVPLKDQSGPTIEKLITTHAP
jgi:hypothetical protein